MRKTKDMDRTPRRPDQQERGLGRPFRGCASYHAPYRPVRRKMRTTRRLKGALGQEWVMGGGGSPGGVLAGPCEAEAREGTGLGGPRPAARRPGSLGEDGSQAHKTRRLVRLRPLRGPQSRWDGGGFGSWPETRHLTDSCLIQRFGLEQRVGERVELVAVLGQHPVCLTVTLLDDAAHLGVDELRGRLAIGLVLECGR